MKKTIPMLLFSSVIALTTNTAKGESAPIPANNQHQTPPARTLKIEPSKHSENDYLLRMQSFLTANQLKISAGTRFLYVNLLNDTKGTPNNNSFIGSIYKLKADQDYTRLKPYVQAEMPIGDMNVGAGISYDSFDVKTADYGTGDGDIETRSLLLYMTAAWPNQTRYKPFGEIGFFFSQNNFDPIPSWYADGLRNFSLDNEQSLYIAGGCDISIRNNWSLNVYARYTDLDVNGIYKFSGDSRPDEPFTFTLEHLAYGFGAQYRF